MSDRGWVADNGCDAINIEGVTSYTVNVIIIYSRCDVTNTVVVIS